MDRKPLIVAIIGWSGSGKTTFIEAAIGECRRRGIAVAAVKKSRHAADIPPDAKDSERFRSAGASPSIYLGESEMVMLSSPPAPVDAVVLAGLCPEASLILCEGLAVEGSLIVLMAGAETTESGLKRPLNSVDILIAREQTMIRAAQAARAAEADRIVDVAHAAKTVKMAVFAPEEVGRFIDHLLSLEETDVR
jgi:molybdopterin-guanine dinucleotide biosynthesis protein B